MKRIDFIVELIKGYDTVADIGSDHGLVLKKALDIGYIKKGIASDIKQGPLDEAKRNLTGYPVAFYLKDGFKDFKASFDIAVITGMGGYLICEILKTVKRDATYLIGPHDNLDVVRKFLVENNFEIIDEYLIFDKFYYVFLKVKKGMMILLDHELYVGKYLYDKPYSKNYFEFQMKHYEKLKELAQGPKKDQYFKIFTYFKAAFLKSS